MKPNYRLIGRILAGGVLLAVTSTVSGKQIVRETWDGLNVLGNLYPRTRLSPMVRHPSDLSRQAHGLPTPRSMTIIRY